MRMQLKCRSDVVTCHKCIYETPLKKLRVSIHNWENFFCLIPKITVSPRITFYHLYNKTIKIFLNPTTLSLQIVTMAIMLAENALAPGVDTVQPKLIPALTIELFTTILTVTIQQLGEMLSSPDNQFQSLQISGGGEEERSVLMLQVISNQSLLLPLKILGNDRYFYYHTKYYVHF